MIFTRTIFDGAFIVDPERIEDDRGFFARVWCPREFEEQGIDPKLAQCSISFNHRKGTVRGMHYQAPPHAEAKLVRCTHGAIFDVIVDLRPESVTFKQWLGVELTASNRRMLYIPRRFVHGFQTLDDETEVHYQISEFHHPESARGLRWDDPAFGIDWPLPVAVISGRDRSYPLYVEAAGDGASPEYPRSAS